MIAPPQQTARRAAWLLAAALLAAAPEASQAAATSAAVERTIAPLLASAPHLAGPLRLLAAYGIPTSAWRSVAHNRRVGGAANSYHLAGYAIDVQRRPGVTHQVLDAALRRAGYLLVESLDEGDHSHFAFLGGRTVAMPIVAAKPITTASMAPPTQPAPAAPPEPRVAADNHGTLLIDGDRPGGNSVQVANGAEPSPALASAE